MHNFFVSFIMPFKLKKTSQEFLVPSHSVSVNERFEFPIEWMKSCPILLFQGFGQAAFCSK